MLVYTQNLLLSEKTDRLGLVHYEALMHCLTQDLQALNSRNFL